MPAGWGNSENLEFGIHAKHKVFTYYVELYYRCAAEENLSVAARESVREKIASADRGDEVSIDLSPRGVFPKKQVVVMELLLVGRDVARLPPIGNRQPKRRVTERPIGRVPRLARAGR